MESRFECPSFGLSLRALRTTKALSIALVGAVAAHLALTLIEGFGQEQRMAKPLTTQFIKRQPRLTKPLELRKRPHPKRRTMRRKMVPVQARVGQQVTSLSVRAVDVVQRLAKPKARVERLVELGATHVEPQTIAGVIVGSKEAKQTVDMSLELLDIDALDTGQYHAMVVQDPTDKTNIQGFCHLAVLFIPRMHNIVVPGWQQGDWFTLAVLRGVRRLADAINQYTQIHADVNKRLTLDSAELFKTPWVIFTAIPLPYELSAYETDVMGRYMMAGGFVFADCPPPLDRYTFIIEAHTQSILACLKSQGVIASPEILPNTHPIYHCYFDFDGPPPGNDAMYVRDQTEGAYIIDHLKGVVVDGRLVAILTAKGYYGPWSYWGESFMREAIRTMDPTRQLQFGVNVIIFALIQEGSITHQVMNTLGH